MARTKQAARKSPAGKASYTPASLASKTLPQLKELVKSLGVAMKDVPRKPVKKAMPNASELRIFLLDFKNGKKASPKKPSPKKAPAKKKPSPKKAPAKKKPSPKKPSGKGGCVDDGYNCPDDKLCDIESSKCFANNPANKKKFPYRAILSGGRTVVGTLAALKALKAAADEKVTILHNGKPMDVRTPPKTPTPPKARTPLKTPSKSSAAPQMRGDLGLNEIMQMSLSDFIAAMRDRLGFDADEETCTILGYDDHACKVSFISQFLSPQEDADEGIEEEEDLNVDIDLEEDLPAPRPTTVPLEEVDEDEFDFDDDVPAPAPKPKTPSPAKPKGKGKTQKVEVPMEEEDIEDLFDSPKKSPAKPKTPSPKKSPVKPMGKGLDDADPGMIAAEFAKCLAGMKH